MVKFIKVGVDGIKLDTIERYGIKCAFERFYREEG